MKFRIKNMVRLRRRFFRHQLPLLVISLVALYVGVKFIFQNDFPDTNRPISLATGYLSLAYIVISLLIGPIRLLLNKRIAVSEDLRRDVGIAAGVTGLAHVWFGLQSHMAGDIQLYFFEQVSPLAIRYGKFGAANYLGLLATIILALLFLLSNDLSLGFLGTKPWKWIQRLNYVLGISVVVHAFLYQYLEQRPKRFMVLVVGLSLLALAIQIRGVFLYRKQKKMVKKPSLAN